MSGKGVVSEILKKKRRGPTDEQGREALKRTSICLPESLYRALKTYAAVEGRKLNELMVEILREGMKKRLSRKDLAQELESL